MTVSHSCLIRFLSVISWTAYKEEDIPEQGCGVAVGSCFASSTCITDFSLVSALFLPIALGLLTVAISRTPGPLCGSRWVQLGSPSEYTSGHCLLPWFSLTGTSAMLRSKETAPTFSDLAQSANCVSMFMSMYFRTPTSPVHLVFNMLC